MKKFLFVIGALALVVYMADNGSHNSGTSTSTPVTQSTTEMSDDVRTMCQLAKTSQLQKLCQEGYPNQFRYEETTSKLSEFDKEVVDAVVEERSSVTEFTADDVANLAFSTFNCRALSPKGKAKLDELDQPRPDTDARTAALFARQALYAKLGHDRWCAATAPLVEKIE
jgi:hypothetical protein